MCLVLTLCSCTQSITSLPSGTTMGRIQFPRIFVQGGDSTYGINFQCPPGKLSDCVGAGMWGGVSVNRQLNR